VPILASDRTARRVLFEDTQQNYLGSELKIRQVVEGFFLGCDLAGKLTNVHPCNAAPANQF
jgi:hypothetical protein